MNLKNRPIGIYIALLTGFALVTLLVCSGRTAEPERKTGAEPQLNVPSLITTSKPSLHTFTYDIPWIGTVQSTTSIQLIALVTGRVGRINVADESTVKKGELITRLEGIQTVNITSPIYGIFTNRHVSTGQELTAGQVIGEIIDTSHLRILASLFSPQRASLPGRKATARLSYDKTITGNLLSVLPQTDISGASMVWITGPQIDTYLKPGQSISGNITLETGKPLLAVPVPAVVFTEQEKPLVFVKIDGKYEARSITIGVEQDGWAQITSGLEQDQTIVIQGAYELLYRQFNEQFKIPD